MAGFKLGRITQDVHRELTAIIRELKDPRISKMLSVVKVQVTNDLSHCTIYVSALEGMEKTVESTKGLDSAKGYIKREISSRLKLRKCPELHFIADDSIAYGAKINQKLQEIMAQAPVASPDEDEQGE